MDHSFIDALDPDRPQVLLMRHAERFAITDIESSMDVLLTEKGKRDAYDLGRLLGGRFGPARLYHSPIKRCFQTAERIMSGMLDGGGAAVVEGPLDWLGGGFVQAEVSYVDGRIGTSGVPGFMRQWFDGLLPEDKIAPPARAARMELGYLHRQMDGKAGLVVDVTHDWNIMLILEHYLNLRHEDIGFPPFLGCLVVSRNSPGGLVLEYQGARKEISA
ncbi:MAG: histidine phosphatase family protein [Spirochaetales bacterium]|nr:histidine phosphatase family protein [Spirochaetales bacterium]